MLMIDNQLQKKDSWTTPLFYTSTLLRHQKKLYRRKPGMIHSFFNTLINVGHNSDVYCAGHHIATVVLV